MQKPAENSTENEEKLKKIEEAKNAVEEVFDNSLKTDAENSKFATPYQVTTIVGLVKKLAGSLPYEEQVHKLLKTIVAVCGIEIVKENEE